MRGRLAASSLRTLDWQREEYERLMGKDAAERQTKPACECEPRELRIERAKRIVHAPHCHKFKPWMQEHQEKQNSSGAAHAAAING